MSNTLQSLDADGRGLQVAFDKQGDRYGHTISLIDGNQVTPLLVARNGDAADDWPPSPPLVQLHIEDRSGGRVILLVGMAGQSHWSVSVHAEPGPAPAIVFDVACRVKEPPRRLGSGYDLTCDVEETGLKIESSQAIVSAENTGLVVEVEPSIGPFPQTLQWQYRVAST